MPGSTPGKLRAAVRRAKQQNEAKAKVRASQTGPPAPKGERTRESILRVAVNLASVEGLEGLTIGRLASELKMSKSGLFAHFGSKEELQISSVQMARTIFTEAVIQPAMAGPKGALRLWAFYDLWLRYIEEGVFAGGCFFTAASFEFDGRPGPVRDSIVAAMKRWLEVLGRAVEEAQRAGHLQQGVDPHAFAFELYALAMGGQSGFQLLDDKKALSKTRAMICERILSVATANCPPIGEKSAEARSASALLT